MASPPLPSAFGLEDAGSIKESGTGLISTNLLSVTLGATFCIPRSRNTLLDEIGGFPVPGAISVSGQLDLTNAVPLLGGLLP
jgi:hypothetical protein